MARVKKTTKAAAPAVETKVEAVETPVVETKAETVETPVVEATTEVEETKEVKKAAAKKTTAKKAAAKEEVKAEAVETPVEETTEVKKTTTKKATLKTTVTLQFAEKSYTEEDLTAIAKDVWTYDLNREVAELKTVELYVKPEEGLCYYVFNGDVAGSFVI